MGLISYFLGLEVTYTNDGRFLSQAKYANDVLTGARLLDFKLVETPLSTSDIILSSNDPFPDPTTYRSLLEAIQYLTITQPNLSYAVNQVSQFLHAPKNRPLSSSKTNSSVCERENLI